MTSVVFISRRAPPGFTLIEMLVVLTIIMLLFLGGFASYREFSRRQVLENAYKELRTNLNLVRQSAISGEKPSSCGENALDGYKVTLNSTNLAVNAVCKGVVQAATKTISIPSSITLSPSANFMYKVLAQGTNLSDTLNIRLANSVTEKCINATISKEGVLERQNACP